MKEEKKLFYGILVFISVVIVLTSWLFHNTFTTPQMDIESAGFTAGQKLLISTNKTGYKPGEIVKISFTNVTNNPIKQQIIPLTRIALTKFLGESYGVGIIEKYEQNNWEAVEPIWRCENSCFKRCLNDQSIKKGRFKVFEWDQTVYICDQVNRTEIVESARLGKYRVFTPVWYDEKQTHKIVYSNEFIIY